MLDASASMRGVGTFLQVKEKENGSSMVVNFYLVFHFTITLRVTVLLLPSSAAMVHCKRPLLVQFNDPTTFKK